MRRAFAPAAGLVLFAACFSPDRLAPTFDQTGQLDTFSLRLMRFSELHLTIWAALRTHLLLIIRSSPDPE